MSNPKLYIIAGPNGAGKTTCVLRFLPYYADCINFVNADLIASGLSPLSPEIAAIKAGKLMLDEIDAFRKRRADFAFETTLAGRTYVPLLKEMRDTGYEVHIYFCGSAASILHWKGFQREWLAAVMTCRQKPCAVDSRGSLSPVPPAG